MSSLGNAIIHNFKNMLRKNSERKQDSSEETKCYFRDFFFLGVMELRNDVKKVLRLNIKTPAQNW